MVLQTHFILFHALNTSHILTLYLFDICTLGALYTDAKQTFVVRLAAPRPRHNILFGHSANVRRCKQFVSNNFILHFNSANHRK